MCFGLTPEQVGNLTYREFSVMMDRYNEQKKTDYEMQRNVIYNAIINTKRKRNARVIPLFQEDNDKSTMDILQEREELFGKNS